MEEIRELEIKGYNVKVRLSIIDSLYEKFRATANFSDYENLIPAIHDDFDKDAAVDGAISKLFEYGHPDIQKHI